MHVMRDFLPGQVDMRATAREKTFTCPFQKVLQFIELRKILCKNQVMNPVFILNFTGRNNERAGIVFKKRFPCFPPDRLKGVSGAEDMDSFCYAG